MLSTSRRCAQEGNGKQSTNKYRYRLHNAVSGTARTINNRMLVAKVRIFKRRLVVRVGGDIADTFFSFLSHIPGRY